MSSHEVPDSCRAAVITEFNQPLQVREITIPELEHGALLVKVDAATVCGSDVHIWDGSLNAIRPIELPVIPGHEMVGTVVALGEGEHTDVVGDALTVGDRIVFTQGRCGTCFHCAVAQQPNLCSNRKNYGDNCERYPYLVGGFAEYCYVYPTSRRIKVPSDVKPEWASAASCALRTVITSFERLGPIEPWETLVIQGSGPLGLFATALARHSGADRIIVVGDPAARLDLAKAWGATDTVSVAQHGEPDSRVQVVRDLTAGQGAEIVMEFSGARTAFTEGLKMVRRGGRYVIAGQVGPHEVAMRPTDITRGHLTILGSFSASEAQYWRAMQFLSRTKERYDFDLLLSTRFHLNEVTSAYTAMRSGQEIKPVIVPTLATA